MKEIVRMRESVRVREKEREVLAVKLLFTNNRWFKHSGNVQG